MSRRPSSADTLDERRRIARELHDGLGHGLLVIAMHARRLPALAPQTRPVAEAIDQTVSDILGQVRTAIGVLRGGHQRPVHGSTAPLSAQVAGLISGLPSEAEAVRFTVRGVEHQVPAHIRDVALRLVQEGLTNTFKHSKGLPVRVDLDFGGDRLKVSVVSGTGELDGQVHQLGGYGLLGMREGVVATGGGFESGPLTDGGFLISAWLPTEERMHEARASGDR
ncbi:histidine kinase [Nonomuraea gerenzanensis]|nr:histidine kinase [Nonomuraea gerenzanensis]